EPPRRGRSVKRIGYAVNGVQGDSRATPVVGDGGLGRGCGRKGETCRARGRLAGGRAFIVPRLLRCDRLRLCRRKRGTDEGESRLCLWRHVESERSGDHNPG